MHDPWTDRLSEYLDGELTADEAARCEGHLRDCAECRAVLDELRRVVARARELPDRPVPDRVWERVAAEIAAPRGVRTAGGVRGRLRRTVHLPLAQVVAAGLAVMIVSGAVGWFVRPLPSTTAAPTPTVSPRADGPSGDAVELRPLDDALWRGGGFEVAAMRWEEAVREQEEVYRRHRAALDTTTVQVLERNLGLIDQSLAEIQEAKEQDPGNPLWNNRLVEGLRRKLRLLRWASSISTREI
jgi:hypothetical protein